MKNFSVSGKNLLRRHTQCFLIILGFFFALMISFIKYLTGPEWALSAFYIFPIILVTWYAGITAGISISIASAISWLLADLMMAKVFRVPSFPI
jgi:hypothetical protein